MDISALKVSNEPMKMSVRHPTTDEEMGIVIMLMGSDYEEYQEKVYELRQDAVKSAPNKELDKLSRQKTKGFLLGILSLHITGWEKIEIDGKPFKYSKDNAIHLMTEWPWMRDQVEEFVDNRANFIKG